MFTYAYMNTKDKPLRRKAAVWFNKICGLKHLTPKYMDRYIMKKIHHKIKCIYWCFTHLYISNA